jgi:hypothetical protein
MRQETASSHPVIGQAEGSFGKGREHGLSPASATLKRPAVRSARSASRSRGEGHSEDETGFIGRRRNLDPTAVRLRDLRSNMES